MIHRSMRKDRFRFLRGGGLLCIISLVYLLTACGDTAQVQPVSTTTAAPVVATCKQQKFETGVVFPRWSPGGYGSKDLGWLAQLPDMRRQTGACWLEMPIISYQDTATSTTIKAGGSTPTLESFAYGARAAHLLGYHVFVTPLVHILTGPRAWAGKIEFPAGQQQQQQEQQWFDGYWQFLKPYAMAAAQAGVEQFSVGTEEDWLEKNAPDSMWNGLIANVRSVFPGTLTYDTNWDSLQGKPSTWMHNPELKMIGVSAYLALVDTPTRIDPPQIPALWKAKAQTLLDNYASLLGRPIFLSEVGYRNTSDTLYTPWKPKTGAPPDPEEQAGAYEAVLVNSLSDPNILGSFFWAWDGANELNIKGLPAVTVMHNRYAPLQA